MYISYVYNLHVSCEEINFYKSHIEWLRDEELIFNSPLLKQLVFKITVWHTGLAENEHCIISHGSVSFAHRRAPLMRMMTPTAWRL